MENSLRLAFVVDVSLGMGWPHRMREKGANYPFESVAPLLQGADLAVANLECCLVDANCSLEAREQRMAVPVELASGLSEVGFRAVNLANNHVLDSGIDGLESTLKGLDSFGIARFGAGLDLNEASAVTYVECRGRRIALLGVAEDTSDYTATPVRPGTAPLQDTGLGCRVETAASNADLVIVSVHADLEFSPVPAIWRTHFSRWLIDRGANLVIQHHPHVLQGIEAYREGLIAYSLGNFVFWIQGDEYQSRHAGVFDSIVLTVSVQLGDRVPSLQWKAEPVRIDEDNRPIALSGDEKQNAFQQLHELSSVLNQPNRVRTAWHRRCRQEARYQMGNLYYTVRRKGLVSGVKDFVAILNTPAHRRWIEGYLSLGYR